MIYTISRELLAALELRKVPFPVTYGPETKEATAIVRDRIVMERDRESGDQIRPPQSQQKNPRVPVVRGIGAKIRIFARSNVAGANVWDHERQADLVADHVLIELRKIATARRQPIAIASAKMLSREELELVGLEQWPGAVYEIRFQIDRGAQDATWAGEAKTEKAFGPGADEISISNQTQVTVNGAGSPETACGG